MKLNFNGKEDEKKIKNKTQVEMGSYVDMLKSREKRMPEMQKEIQEFFDNWSGETIIMVKTENDENGDPIGCHQVIMGVDKPTVLLSLARHLDHTQEHIMEQLMESGDPKLLATMAVDMMRDLLKEISNDKKN